MYHVIFLVVGIVNFLAALFLIRKEVTMRRNGIRTTGVVAGVEREYDSEGGVLYRPLVRFVTNDGQQKVWKSSVAGTSLKNSQGKSVRIIYDSGNPDRVISDHWSAYLRVLLLCLLSAVCIAFSLGMVPIG